MGNAGTVAARAARMLSSLTADERRAAVESLRRLVERETFDLACDGADDGSAVACPRCGSVSFVKRGRDAKGIQRHLCKDCGRTLKPNRIGPA